jgi:hypothetical protein
MIFEAVHLFDIWLVVYYLTLVFGALVSNGLIPPPVESIAKISTLKAKDGLIETTVLF